jgi:peptidylprolyl isomerase
MQRRLMLIALTVLFTAALFCETGDVKGEKLEYITTESGLRYAITEAGDGAHPKKGDKVVVHYTGTLEDGTEFDSSVKRGQPFSFDLGAGRVIKGWDEGFSLLRQGDKAFLNIPPELGYGSRDMGPIPANSTLIFEVELLEIIAEKVIEPYNTDNKVVLTTDSGLKFILIEEGNGKKAASGYDVSVHYTGFLADGSIFDSSIKRGTPFSFTLGMQQVIKGWDEGIALMKIGDRAKLVIPYELAYGERGRPPVIPPKAELIFDVELLDVK